jgi:hypothetical protein
MADRRSLNILGLIMSAATIAVVLVGVFMVQGHLAGRFVLEQPVASQ